MPDETEAMAHKCMYWFHHDDDNRLRLCLIRENKKGFFKLGRGSHDPLAMKPRTFESDDEAECFCIVTNEQVFGMSRDEQMMLVFRSMSCDEWRVRSGPDSDQVTILKDGDEVAVLSSDEAESLYEQLQTALFSEETDDDGE
jgi:hypothetical protein